MQIVRTVCGYNFKTKLSIEIVENLVSSSDFGSAFARIRSSFFGGFAQHLRAQQLLEFARNLHAFARNLLRTCICICPYSLSITRICFLI